MNRECVSVLSNGEWLINEVTSSSLSRNTCGQSEEYSGKAAICPDHDCGIKYNNHIVLAEVLSRFETSGAMSLRRLLHWSLQSSFRKGNSCRGWATKFSHHEKERCIENFFLGIILSLPASNGWTQSEGVSTTPNASPVLMFPWAVS